MQITVYSTPTCPYCHQVKQYLRQSAIPFHDVDVSQDALAAQEMVRLTGQRGVPVTVAGNEIILGYDRPRLEQLVRSYSRPRLGAAVADAAEMLAKGRPSLDHGVYVGTVHAGGAAEQAGLRSGDVLISFAHQTLSSSLHLERLLAGVQPGSQVPISFVRDGDTRHVVLRF